MFIFQFPMCFFQCLLFLWDEFLRTWKFFFRKVHNLGHILSIYFTIIFLTVEELLSLLWQNYYCYSVMIEKIMFCPFTIWYFHFFDENKHKKTIDDRIFAEKHLWIFLTLFHEKSHHEMTLKTPISTPKIKSNTISSYIDYFIGPRHTPNPCTLSL